MVRLLSPPFPPLSSSLLTRVSVWCTAEAESHEGKRKTESLWPIMRITHTRTRFVFVFLPSFLRLRLEKVLELIREKVHRYIYDMYYKREAISKELYDWLLKQEYADAK